MHSSLPIYTMRLHPQCTYAFNANDLESELSDDLPSDISESELLDMLTECMAVKLLQDKEQIRAINNFDPNAVLPEPKRKRDQKEKETIETLSDTSENYIFKTNPYFYKLRKR